MAPKRKTNGKAPVIYWVTPLAQALEQAENDMKQGVRPKTIYDPFLDRQAARKKWDKKEKVTKPKKIQTPKIKMISPVALALEQAKSDLKRGVHQTTIYDDALERDAERKKLSIQRQARRKKWMKDIKNNRNGANKKNKSRM